MIQKQLLTKMHKFDFVNNNENELKNLSKKLAEKEMELLSVNPEKLVEDTEDEIVSADDVKNMREEILQDLKQSNPELERDTWV